MVAMPEGGIQVTSHLRLLTPAFIHASFIGLQERFLALLEMTARESLASSSLLVTSYKSPVTSHQSLVTSPQPLATVSKVPQHLIGVIGLDDEDRAVIGGKDSAAVRDEDFFTADECADEAFLGEARFHE